MCTYVTYVTEYDAIYINNFFIHYKWTHDNEISSIEVKDG